MSRIRIDFAPLSLRRAILRAPRAVWVVAVAALGLAPTLVGTANEYRQLLREREGWSAQVLAVQATRPAPAAPVRAPIPAAQAGAVDAAVRQLNLPWRALHDAVQSSASPNVALLAVEPDAKKNNLRITAEAKGSDDMLAYVDALKAQDWFGAVSLVRHEINEQDPNRPIRFQVDAGWKAAP